MDWKTLFKFFVVSPHMARRAKKRIDQLGKVHLLWRRQIRSTYLQGNGEHGCHLPFRQLSPKPVERRVFLGPAFQRLIQGAHTAPAVSVHAQHRQIEVCPSEPRKARYSA